MPETEFFTFTLPPDAWRKKPVTSPFKMTRTEAERRYPGAIAVESTREVRQLDAGRVIAGKDVMHGRQHERSSMGGSIAPPPPSDSP